jgi:hypothetical protein
VAHVLQVVLPPLPPWQRDAHLLQLTQHALIPHVEELQQSVDILLVVVALVLQQVQLELTGEELPLVDAFVLSERTQSLDGVTQFCCLPTPLRYHLLRLLKHPCHILCADRPGAVALQTQQVLLDYVLLFILVLLDLGVYFGLYVEVIEDVTEGEFTVKSLRSEGIL